MSPELKAYCDAYFRFLDEILKSLERIAKLYQEAGF